MKSGKASAVLCRGEAMLLYEYRNRDGDRGPPSPEPATETNATPLGCCCICSVLKFASCPVRLPVLKPAVRGPYGCSCPELLGEAAPLE